jgi:hypothetical protein
MAGNVLTATFSGVQGHAYIIEYRDDLGAIGWRTFFEVPVLSSSGPVEVPCDAAANPGRYFRVSTTPSP